MLASSRTIKQIKAMVAKFLDQQCELLQQSDTIDDYGNQDYSWSTVAAGVPCRLITDSGQSTTSEVRRVGDQESLVESYRVILPADTDIESDMRVKIGSNEYTVIDVLDSLSNSVNVQVLVTRARN